MRFVHQSENVYNFTDTLSLSLSLSRRTWPVHVPNFQANFWSNQHLKLETSDFFRLGSMVSTYVSRLVFSVRLIKDNF